MNYWFHHKNGKVACYSENPIVSDKLLSVQLEIDVATYNLMQQNYDLFIENGKLVCKPNARIISEQNQANLQAYKDKLQAGSATQQDIIAILALLVG